MNRTELEALTRDELLAMARSEGVDGAEWLSREELVTALERLGARGRGGLIGRARALFERALDLGQRFARKSEPPPEPRDSTPPSTSTETKAPERAAAAHPAAGPERPIGAGPSEATETSNAPEPSGASQTAGAPESEPLPAPAKGDGVSGPPTEPARSTPQGPSTETQFQTLTMAEVYAGQGLFAEARQIAQSVLDREPHNAAAAAFLSRPQGQATMPPPQGAGPMFLDLEEPPPGYGEDVVSLFMVAPTDLYAYWEVTPEGRARAAQSLGEAGTLILQLFEATATGTRTRDIEISQGVGEWFVHGVAAGARHMAAVGLKGAEGRFVPIAHSGPALTPLAQPSKDTRVEWMEVRLPARGAELRPPEVVGCRVPELRAQARARQRAIEGWPKGSSELHLDRTRG